MEMRVRCRVGGYKYQRGAVGRATKIKYTNKQTVRVVQHVSICVTASRCNNRDTRKRRTKKNKQQLIACKRSVYGGGGGEYIGAGRRQKKVFK